MKPLSLLIASALRKAQVKTPDAPTRTRPAPTPTRTPSPGKPDPWRPPRPAHLPAPKNSKRTAAFEDEAAPSNVKFWRSIPRNHPFFQHPVLQQKGFNLAKGGFEFTNERYNRQNIDHRQAFAEIMRIEGAHKAQLQQLAKQATMQVWGVPEDILNPMLGQGKLEDEGGGVDEEETAQTGLLSRSLVPHVHKRVTLNALTQGSAVHSMFTIHYIVKDALDAIDPNLIPLYNSFASGSAKMYFEVDLASMIGNLGGMTVGQEKVEWEGEKPQVEACGIIFPILCQELSKGCMELLTAHGLQDVPPESLPTVYEHADKPEDEHWLIQVGPELWRKFLSVLPSGLHIRDAVVAISKLPPNQVHDIVNKVIEKPSEATTILKQYIPKEEDDVWKDSE